MKKVVVPLVVLIFFIVVELIVMYWWRIDWTFSVKQIIIIIFIPVIMIILAKKLKWTFTDEKLNMSLIIVLVLLMIIFRCGMIGYRAYKFSAIKKTEAMISTMNVNTVKEALMLLSNNSFSTDYSEEYEKLERDNNKILQGGTGGLYDDWRFPYTTICIMPRMNLISVFGNVYGFDKNIDRQIQREYTTPKYSQRLVSLNDYIHKSILFDNGLTVWETPIGNEIGGIINKDTGILIAITLYEIMIAFVMYKTLKEN